ATGCGVPPAAAGWVALEMARAEKPDLVLLDLIMPRLQGFEVLRRLKQDPATEAIPVIVLSNLSQPTDVQEAMRAGAAGYYVKADLSLQALAERVEAVVGR